MLDGEKIYIMIKKEMVAKKINQSDIAKELNVSRANVSIMFSRVRKNKISLSFILKVSQILNCDFKFFL